jgi:hypothetical protein
MNTNDTPIHPLHALIKRSVGETLTNAKLGSSPEFEGYVADMEAERILREIGRTHLSLKRLLKLQLEFAGMKRKYTKQNGREKVKTKVSGIETIPE